MFDNNNKNEVIEKLSALFDGQELPEGEIVQCRSEDAKKHMKNWSLIGSAMRNELPEKIDLGFSDSVMSKLELEENVGLTKLKSDLNDQVQVNQRQNYRLMNFFKRSAIVVAELAVAASVAVFTVVGWQTYVAGDIANTYESSVAGNTLSPVGGINLASYQGGSHAIHLNPQSTNTAQSDDLKKMQKNEIERINSYVNGFVLDNSLR